MRRTYIDKPLALLIAILIVGGALIFASAAFGLLGRGANNITSVVANHLLLGIGFGLLMLVLTTSIDYRLWRRFAPYIFAASLLATAAVFLPHIGAEHGGGRRWILLLGISFQPSEALKFASIVVSAAYCAAIRDQVKSMTAGLGGLLLILSFPAMLLVLQPDIGTLGVICISTFSIFWAAGARFRDMILLGLIGVLIIAALAFAKPYVRDRVTTFLNPAQGQQAESYQIRQSLIAVGSGGIFGRGFGQGIQKFTYLPEPMGDSIFAVLGEELGFAGAVATIVLFTLFALRGYHIASHTHDTFGAYLATGISTYLAIEAFINIASMLGVAPLTGIPLTFMSQGGSAMLVSLGSAGVLLNISRTSGKKRV